MNEERYILFDQYLQGEMTVEEKDNFEKQLSEDHELSSEFETFKEVQLRLKTKFEFEDEREAFKANLTEISDKHFNTNKPKVVLMRPWYYAAAASVIILFGLFFFDYNNPSFADYDNPETASFVERGDTNQALIGAQTAFNDGKYAAAIPLFEEILKENKTPEIQYFYGVALLEESKYPKAESVFNELKSGTSAYKDKATWSLALSKLKQKKYTECKEILETISQDYENYDDVEKLLDELN
ncbi:tetratricopeptide repeat protein [Flavobacterium bizetiae]|uniref:tetratricopeptide repeat protein n=1 Tax=Flavobacterium bizetiae TaxID=2704140 RepID=UPI0021E97876|nr:tetratricopeptide repeat protein [Flavobacterium bizetiae]UTN05555.1 tetratricopeptide repeat protein [Flavobacterium bizetiae]